MRNTNKLNLPIPEDTDFVDLPTVLDDAFQKIDEVSQQCDSSIATLESNMTTKEDNLREEIRSGDEALQQSIENNYKNLISKFPPPNMASLDTAQLSTGIKFKYKVNVGSRLGAKEDSPIVTATAGVMVRYSTTGYPKNINDGVLLVNDNDVTEVDSAGQIVAKNKEYDLTGISKNENYYFSCFSYSAEGVYNTQLGKSNCMRRSYSVNTLSVVINGLLNKYINVLVTLTPKNGEQPITAKGSGDKNASFGGVNQGSYTLSFGGLDGYITPPDQNVEVGFGEFIQLFAEYVKKPLSDYTWDEINEISRAGKAQEMFALYDTKDVNVGGETLTFEIVGFDHDDLVNGDKAGITFATKNLMADARRMNASNTNAGGFTGSEMYSWLQNDLLPILPSDLKSAIKMVNKKTSRGNQNSEINTDAMKLFLFSEKEIFNTNSCSYSGEGYQYPCFETTSRRVKKLANGSGDAVSWWLRSPDSGGSVGFCRVYLDGSIINSAASLRYGVCWGFCV